MTLPDIGVTPHTSWRPNQAAILREIFNICENGGGVKVIFAELPTGSGKTAVAAGLVVKDKVTAVVQTLSLLRQYRDIYGFDIIMGKQEYPCSHDEKRVNWKVMYDKVPTAADCHYDNMHECPYSTFCPYLIAKEKALRSNKMACTYKYMALSESARERDGFLVLDEAHESVKQFLTSSEFTVTRQLLLDNNLPIFPSVNANTAGGEKLSNIDRVHLIEWFDRCLNKLGMVDLFDQMTFRAARQKALFDFFRHGLDVVQDNEPVFAFTGIPRQENFLFSKKSQPSLILKPLSVKQTAQAFIAKKHTVIFMSATLGNPRPLAAQLGIEQYESFSYPHPIPTSKRPVIDLGIPKMTHDNLKAIPNLHKIQAIVIAEFIKKLPSDWRGIVLAPSMDKISKLREHLTPLLPGRVYQPAENEGQGSQIDGFIADNRPGLIAIGTMQGWGTGLDFRGDMARFVVIAGIPYPNPSDKYDIERMKTDGGKAYAFWESYSSVVQAAGRVSRGELAQDGSFLFNIAAVADGGAMTPSAMLSYPTWFKDAIQPESNLSALLSLSGERHDTGLGSTPLA